MLNAPKADRQAIDRRIHQYGDKFRRTIGNEWTFLHPSQFMSKKGIGDISMEGEPHNKLPARLEKLPGRWRAHDDDGVLEVNSPARKTIHELAEDWIDLWSVLKPLGYITHHPRCMNGGGHVHVDIGKDATIWRNYSNFLILTPYLPWILNDPSDPTDGGMWPPSLCGNLTMREWRLNGRLEIWGATSLCPNSIRNQYKGSRGIVHTMECRFFDGPANVVDAIDHAVFADRLLDHLATVPYPDVPIPAWLLKAKKTYFDVGNEPHYQPAYNLAKRWPKTRILRAFHALLETMRLPRENYARFITRNLDVRLQFPEYII